MKQHRLQPRKTRLVGRSGSASQHVLGESLCAAALGCEHRAFVAWDVHLLCGQAMPLTTAQVPRAQRRKQIWLACAQALL